MEELLLKYKDQVKSIAVHAKSIGFDSEKGNWDDLFRSWIHATKAANEFIESNKEDVMRKIKYIL